MKLHFVKKKIDVIERELTFRLRGPRICDLDIGTGYGEPLNHQEAGLQRIVLDVGHAIVHQWTVVKGSGVLQPPKDAAAIFGDGHFVFESMDIKVLSHRSMTSPWHALLEVCLPSITQAKAAGPCPSTLTHTHSQSGGGGAGI